MNNIQKELSNEAIDGNLAVQQSLKNFLDEFTDVITEELRVMDFNDLN